MDFVVHTEGMFHIEAVSILFIAPGGFTHIGPETTNTVIQHFLLITAPPVGHTRFGKIDHAAVSAPRPGHIVTFSGADIFG